MTKHIDLFSLLEGKIDNNFCDRVFWFGRINKIFHDNLEIHIDSSNCLVAFDEYVRYIGCKAISDMTNINRFENPEEAFSAQIPVLISSGCFLWINNRLLLTRRDNKTKFDPLHWTTPAGRCDRLPRQTALKELIEEIVIYNEAKIYMAEQAKPFVKNENVYFYKAIEQFPPDGLNPKLHTIHTYIDNKLVESAKMWYFYNPRVNTLELRLPLMANLPQDIQVRNAEFDQPAHLVTMQELRNLKLVPAVRQLVKEMLDV